MSVSQMFWNYIKAKNINGIRSIREVSLSLNFVNGAVTTVATRLLINKSYYIDYIGGTPVASYF